jgi:hypothetical protein
VTANTFRRSFAGGVIAPELFGRVDLTKHQTGVEIAENMIVLPHGPLRRRPGFRYVNEARVGGAPVRLIPFVFAVGQSIVLELGDYYIRFYSEGQSILENERLVSSVTGNHVTMVDPHGWSTGDDAFIAGRLGRIVVDTATSFWLTTPVGTPIEVPTDAAVAARLYVLASPYPASALFGLTYAQDNDIVTLCHPDFSAMELRRLGAASWSLTAVSFAPTLAAPTGLTVTPTSPTATNPSPQEYVVTSVAADGVSESLPSPSVTVANNLAIAGNYNTVSWSAEPAAARYNAYKKRGGAFGFIGQTTELSLVDDNVLPDTTRPPPDSFISLNTGEGDYPAAVVFHEQRRWFGGTSDDPQSVWGTRTGTSSNLTSSIPAQDDDALQLRVRSRQHNTVRHLVPLIDLLALTSGGEFRIFAEGGPAISPTTLSVKPQGYTGVAAAQPVTTGAAVLYAQARGAHVRELAYNWQTNTFASLDLSLMAPHLFDGYEILDLAYMQAPYTILWAARNDGVLLGLTYVPEHQIYAWHLHTTDGVVESVCVVPEEQEDVLYLVVRRTVGGRTVRFIERMGSMGPGAPDASFFVDAGATYEGVPVTTLSGLQYLEGREVQVLADEGVHPVRTVTSGAIELEAEASVVHVGLASTARVKTLPIHFESAPAGGQGSTKNVNAVMVRVADTGWLKAGPSFDRLTEYLNRADGDAFGAAPALLTEELRFEVLGDWNAEGAVCIEQSDPVNLFILSLALDVAPGG